MAFYVEDGEIYITRGDDAYIECSIKTDDGSEYPMQADDVITLTVRELPRADSPVLLSVRGAPGGTRIILRGADTEGIEAGRYSADMQLGTWDGRRYTFWPQLEGDSRYKTRNLKNFIVMPEVTV